MSSAVFNLPQRPTIEDIHSLYSQKKATVSQVVNECFARIENLDPKIGAFIQLTQEKAKTKAKEQDQILETQDFQQILKEYPLFGIPFAVKDLILVEGLQITAQSKILENYIAPYSSDVYKRMDSAGCVLMGVTNMDEFAFGSSTEKSGYGNITKNPIDKERVPGGTSGGSAAAVASGMIPVALGSDTGGSIRQPSSFCSTVGIRPSYGLVPRYGVIPSTSSCDQVGPITNSIKDNQKVLEILAGKSNKDQTSLNQELAKSKEVKTIAIPKECFEEGVDQSVKQKFEELKEKLQKAGYSINIVDLKTLKYTLSTYYITLFVEASANLERFDGIRYGKQPEMGGTEYFSAREFLGEEVKRRIMLGTYASSSGYYDAYYNKACMAREKIIQDFKQVFEENDVIITPASPFPAFKIGENNEDPLAMYLADVFTVPQSMAKTPGLVVPIGDGDYQGKKLPIGLQITGPILTEKSLYSFASKVEELM